MVLITWFSSLANCALLCNVVPSKADARLAKFWPLSRGGGIHMGGSDAHDPGLQLCDNADDS